MRNPRPRPRLVGCTHSNSADGTTLGLRVLSASFSLKGSNGLGHASVSASHFLDRLVLCLHICISKGMHRSHPWLTPWAAERGRAAVGSAALAHGSRSDKPRSNFEKAKHGSLCVQIRRQTTVDVETHPIAHPRGLAWRAAAHVARFVSKAML